MLTQDRALTYIKRHLGYPYRNVELDDDEILDYMTEYTLREFSTYHPDVKKVRVNFANSNRANGRENEFYIYDPDNIEILNVKKVYFGTEQIAMHGHPLFGPFGMNSIEEWALAVETSKMVQHFSTYNRITQFMPPNMIRISPGPDSGEIGIAEYERMHPTHLGTIPNDLQMIFCKFATADIKILLGEIRKVYEGNLRTPFGEIPISREIGDDGKSEKDALTDKLEELKLPNIVMSIG